MKILFFSTNSNFYDKENLIYTTVPSFEEQWEEFKRAHPADEFCFVTQLPGMFLPVNQMAVKDTINDDTDEIAEIICGLKPDLAVAMSFWVAPYDWLPVKDALVGEKLKSKGIKTICHSVDATMTCFDKWEMHNFLVANSFPYAPGLLVKHDLFFCAGNQRDVKTNVYKEAVLSQIKSLHFPLIIKDNVGLSSYGMEVCNTYGQVVNYLNSKKNNSDRLIEEYLDGEQFGAEIYGTAGNYTVLPPLSFSLNQYGITSPKLSVKQGPLSKADLEKKNWSECEKMLLQVAEKLNFSGVAQVDLIYHNSKWYIIEINPRLSGMTLTYSASAGKSVYEIIYQTCVERKKLDTEKMQSVLNQKYPLMPAEELKTFAEKNNFIYVSQIENKAAKQEREKGYCEGISFLN